jgi:acetyl-CoA C-acetyltransferase
VFFRGAGQEKDPVYVASHPDLGASPAMAIAASTALRAAGIGIDEVTYLDLYSCFGSSVNLACDALGLKTDDQRGFTVTGGLPFAGGPGSGYMLHSAATMVDRLRADPGTFGLASGVGMHMTKHAFGIYSTTPPPAPLGPPPPATVPHEKSITDTYSGSATVATYTVVHDRSGAPEWGVAVCDLPDGSRTYGRFEEPDLLAHAEETEWVGSPVRLQSTPEGVNRVHP